MGHGQKEILDALSNLLDLTFPSIDSQPFSEIRRGVLKSLDSILLSPNLWKEEFPFYSGGPERSVPKGPVMDFHHRRVTRALRELEQARARRESGIWMFYNMGCVLMWKGWTMGFDLVGGVNRFDWSWPAPEGFLNGLVDNLDCLAVTHYLDWNPSHRGVLWHHLDHFWPELVEAMALAGKRVILPRGLQQRGVAPETGVVWLGHGQRMRLGPARIFCHGTYHAYQDNPFDTPHLMYWVDLTDQAAPPDGEELPLEPDHYAHEFASSSEAKAALPGAMPEKSFRFLFSGDTDYTRADSLPAGLDPDLAVLHFGGISPAFDGGAGEDSYIADLRALLLGARRLGTQRIIAAHLAELGHPSGGGRESYEQALKAVSAAGRSGDPFVGSMKISVLAWGEHLDIQELPRRERRNSGVSSDSSSGLQF